MNSTSLIAHIYEPLFNDTYGLLIFELFDHKLVKP